MCPLLHPEPRCLNPRPTTIDYVVTRGKACVGLSYEPHPYQISSDDFAPGSMRRVAAPRPRHGGPDASCLANLANYFISGQSPPLFVSCSLCWSPRTVIHSESFILRSLQTAFLLLYPLELVSRSLSRTHPFSLRLLSQTLVVHPSIDPFRLHSSDSTCLSSKDLRPWSLCWPWLLRLSPMVGRDSARWSAGNCRSLPSRDHPST